MSSTTTTTRNQTTKRKEAGFSFLIIDVILFAVLSLLAGVLIFF